MTLPLQIKVAGDAQAQIEEAAAWWAQNRPLAPGAVRQDLDRILGLLAAEPGIGARAKRAKLQGVRRITLSRIRYYDRRNGRWLSSNVEMAATHLVAIRSYGYLAIFMLIFVYGKDPV